MPIYNWGILWSLTSVNILIDPWTLNLLETEQER